MSSISQSVSTNTVSVRGPVFQGDNAYAFLKDQCAFGPRVPGGVAHRRCRDYILGKLQPFVDEVTTQNWSYRDNARDVTLPLTNILAIINPHGTRKIMLFTHWDTRPTSDQEVDLDQRAKPIMGADDGASGTAVLLELAQVLHAQKPDVCVELLFVDGEDWGPGEDKMYLGAIHFAKNPGAYRPEFAVLLDMIGYSNQYVFRERSSETYDFNLDNTIWNDAASLGYSKNFPNAVKYQISDDHDSFNAAGIPAVDLIDFDYPYWHTQQDTADKCSGASLKVVGDVMEKLIYDQH